MTTSNICECGFTKDSHDRKSLFKKVGIKMIFADKMGLQPCKKFHPRKRTTIAEFNSLLLKEMKTPENQSQDASICKNKDLGGISVGTKPALHIPKEQYLDTLRGSEKELKNLVEDLYADKNICECGHHINSHRFYNSKNAKKGCQIEGCPCKKFEPLKEKVLLFCDNPACFATHLAKKHYGKTPKNQSQEKKNVKQSKSVLPFCASPDTQI